jgi:hypothetical protein
VVNTNWNFTDEFMWKAMNSSYIALLPPASGIGYIMPGVGYHDQRWVTEEEKRLEKDIKDNIAQIRMSDE